MASDDLNAPLGQDKRKKRIKLPIVVPQVLAGALALCALTVIGWAVFADNPLGGQPVAVVSTASLKPAERAGDSWTRERPNRHAAIAAKGAAQVKATDAPPGSRTITIIDGSSGKRQQVIVPGNAAAEKAPIDRQLLQTTANGSIPQIAADGTRSFTRYASAYTVPANRRDAPRIAIVIGDLGISASATAEAIATLPPPITFALSPYGSGLDALAARARADKHEILLQIPMEPLDYPNNDPGPRTLLTTLTSEQNIDRLHWFMARFGGYVGLASSMGSRFMDSASALKPVLHEIAKRGLIFVDDSSSSRSIASGIAGSLNLPFAKADIVLDAVPTKTAIDQSLTRLEMAARAHGSAVGYASAQPGAIARIALWAKTVESRGFALVPITRIAVKEKSS